jgi:hypothetical protein
MKPMKPIKIIPSNYDAIRAELDRVNGRASSFTIGSAMDVQRVTERAEKRLSMLPKADRSGAKASYIPEGPSARAYKYEAKSTCVYVERRSSAWYLVDVRSTTVYPRDSESLTVHITPAQAAEIARRAVADFSIMKPATTEETV